MKTIYKYAVVSGLPVKTYAGWKPLSVQYQNDELFVWALVDTNQPQVDKKVYIMGTGWNMDDFLESVDYLGTVQEDVFVWHVFFEP